MRSTQFNLDFKPTSYEQPTLQTTPATIFLPGRHTTQTPSRPPFWPTLLVSIKEEGRKQGGTPLHSSPPYWDAFQSAMLGNALSERLRLRQFTPRLHSEQTCTRVYSELSCDYYALREPSSRIILTLNPIQNQFQFLNSKSN